ncbi:hypothetical protein A2U01_0093290, partial [Trifolium medium]|nr:hypothetical protein [Trifolium medium]
SSTAACPDLVQPVSTLSDVAASRHANHPHPPRYLAPSLDPIPPCRTVLPEKKIETPGRSSSSR